MSTASPHQQGRALVTVLPPSVAADPAVHVPPADSRYRVIIEIETDAPFLTADIQRLISQQMLVNPEAHITLHINRPVDIFHPKEPA